MLSVQKTERSRDQPSLTERPLLEAADPEALPVTPASERESDELVCRPLELFQGRGRGRLARSCELLLR